MQGSHTVRTFPGPSQRFSRSSQSLTTVKYKDKRLIKCCKRWSSGVQKIYYFKISHITVFQ